jgi:hypothetical protein
MRDEELLAEIEDFLEGFDQLTCRGVRVNGVQWRRGQAKPAGVATRGRRGGGLTNPSRVCFDEVPVIPDVPRKRLNGRF